VSTPEIERRTLVTGAGGFVGANLVRRLLSDGHAVAATVRPGGDLWRLGGLEREVELCEVELRDEEMVRRAVRATRPEWLFHLATHPYGEEALESQVTTNLLATASLLRASAEVGCEAFVHAGTSLEYGHKDHAPAEDELPDPNTEYALAKAAATMLCRHVSRSSGLPAVTLRLYSVYGPYEHPRRLIPTLVAHGLRGALPPLANPDTQRDFVAVDDVVEAFVLAAAAENPEPGAVYNIGTGVGTSLAEVVELARRTLGIEAEAEWGSLPPRRWDTAVWVADSRKARARLGWAPRLELERGFRETVEWLHSERSLWDRYGVTRARSPH
jgi:UDP-glucose 4-epimerase